MRVITGSAKGRRLITLDGEDVRPTADRVKEGLFSAIQLDIAGRSVLDLFGGCGQLAIEALSRGASEAVINDESTKAVLVIHKNLDACGLQSKATVTQMRALDYLQTTSRIFDLAFLDPPYRSNILQDVLPKVAGVMSADGVIVCEHPVDESMPEKVSDFKISKQYRYGKIMITIYRKPVEA